MTFDELMTRIGHDYDMKTHNNVKCDVNVKIKNKKLNPLHEFYMPST